MKRAVKRVLLVFIGWLLQIILSFTLLAWLGKQYAIIEVLYALLSIIITLGIIKNSKNLQMDLLWLIIIPMYPIFGVILYIALNYNKKRSPIIKRIKKTFALGQKYYHQDEKILKEIEKENHSQIKYLINTAKFPAYTHNKVKYFPLGDDVFDTLIKELKKAEKFIFLEYFIIGLGEKWGEILSVLKEKARQGLDVRVIYDDFGSMQVLPDDYKEELELYDIKCVVFNKLHPLSSLIMNNRDHRKILVIDGHTAFSGGINLSDEYFNVYPRFGHWKDNAFMVKGDAVWSYTVMFLSMWNSYLKEDKDYTVYKYDFKNNKPNKDGFIIPYSDSPLESETVGENVYMNMINQSKKYLYITTPYLIIDKEIEDALILAAKRGVDVRIITPGIPDKKMVYTVTKSYFLKLIQGGVSIYTYKPGFIHSKIFICDDKVCTIGTINMDFRSFYHHFECGLFMQNNSTIKDVKKDVVETFDKCHKVTQKEATPNLIKSFWQALLRLIAPLL